MNNAQTERYAIFYFKNQSHAWRLYCFASGHSLQELTYVLTTQTSDEAYSVSYVGVSGRLPEIRLIEQSSADLIKTIEKELKAKNYTIDRIGHIPLSIETQGTIQDLTKNISV